MPAPHVRELSGSGVLQRNFAYSRALRSVRFDSDHGFIDITWNNGRRLRYIDCTMDDYQTLTHGRSPGQRVRQWLEGRREQGMPPGRAVL